MPKLKMPYSSPACLYRLPTVSWVESPDGPKAAS
jgi:hypothetical protein